MQGLKLEMCKRAIIEIISQLQPDDRFFPVISWRNILTNMRPIVRLHLVTYETYAKVIWEDGSQLDAPQLKEKLSNIKAVHFSCHVFT